MDMPIHTSVEPVTLTEILALDTWNQERSDEQLRSFIDRRHVAAGVSESDFDI